MKIIRWNSSDFTETTSSLNSCVVQATVDEGEEAPEEKPKAKGGFLSMLGFTQETIYADEDWHLGDKAVQAGLNKQMEEWNEWVNN